ncbi:hypothetical protein [Marinitenerispora sediminis]|nr:hypothetical protein [Marinitenerispora sediminis]RCV50907.1 hypothetical protein DEF28_16775 [Marinitenerispora sediminis]RCV59733.1 hypothetical protein DEF23_06590 [Marinitenerispora sediminis]
MTGLVRDLFWSPVDLRDPLFGAPGAALDAREGMLAALERLDAQARNPAESGGRALSEAERLRTRTGIARLFTALGEHARASSILDAELARVRDAGDPFAGFRPDVVGAAVLLAETFAEREHHDGAASAWRRLADAQRDATRAAARAGAPRALLDECERAELRTRVREFDHAYAGTFTHYESIAEVAERAAPRAAELFGPEDPLTARLALRGAQAHHDRVARFVDGHEEKLRALEAAGRLAARAVAAAGAGAGARRAAVEIRDRVAAALERSRAAAASPGAVPDPAGGALGVRRALAAVRRGRAQARVRREAGQQLRRRPTRG